VLWRAKEEDAGVGGWHGDSSRSSLSAAPSAAGPAGGSPGLCWYVATGRARLSLEPGLRQGGQAQEGVSCESRGDVTGLCLVLSACGWWTCSREAGLQAWVGWLGSGVRLGHWVSVSEDKCRVALE